MKKNKSLAYYVSEFLMEYLTDRRNLSDNTIGSYRDMFKLLFAFCAQTKGISPEKLSVSDINRKTIDEFMLWLKENRHCSESTCNQRLGAIRSFFKHLQYEAPEYAHQCQQVLEIRMMKAQEPELKYLTLDGVRVLLEEPDLRTTSGRRDLAMLSLMYDSAARAQEVANLQFKDIRLISPPIIRLKGKGRKTRTVPLLSGTEKILKQYMRDLPEWKKDGEHAVFCNRNGNELTRHGITYILQKHAKSAREKYPELIPDVITPHVLRHSKAMHLLQANVNIVYIRDLLGHTSINTTEIYARADTTLKREALERASPIKERTEIPNWHKDEKLMEWLRSLGK